MTILMPYGRDSTLRLDLPPGVRVEYCDAPRGQGQSDASAAVAAALAKPLNYPPLAQATFPGDRIVVAVGEGVPQTENVVRAVVAALVAGGSSPEDITVLTTAAHRRGFDGVPSIEPAAVSEASARQTAGHSPEPDTRWSLAGAPARLPFHEGELSHLVHDPADRRQIALLARAQDHMPILLHRALLDADVVVSIGSLGADDAPGYNGPAGSLCPTFSDQATQQRFRALHLTEVPGQHAARAHAKAQEAVWLLGARFTVQIVPGRGEEVLHVLAGDIDEVATQGRALYEHAWRFPQPATASLVITAIEGGPNQQTWENVGRAIATAAPLAEPGGAVAVCCDLDAPPGAALQQLTSAEDAPSALRAMRKSSSPDALAAVQLAQALQDLHIYLLSRLSRFTVDELGAVPVSAPEELTHFARTRPSCLLLSGGPHIRMAPEVRETQAEP